MVCVALLLLQSTPLHCSVQQLPSSGDDDLQEITTLQNRLADNCTILIIKTGEKLDVAYTGKGLTGTTPMSGHTSQVTTKTTEQNTLLCYGY